MQFQLRVKKARQIVVVMIDVTLKINLMSRILMVLCDKNSGTLARRYYVYRIYIILYSKRFYLQKIKWV